MWIWGDYLSFGVRGSAGCLCLEDVELMIRRVRLWGTKEIDFCSVVLRKSRSICSLYLSFHRVGSWHTYRGWARLAKDDHRNEDRDKLDGSRRLAWW